MDVPNLCLKYVGMLLLFQMVAVHLHVLETYDAIVIKGKSVKFIMGRNYHANIFQQQHAGNIHELRGHNE